MATRRGHGLRLPSGHVRGADHLQSVKDGSENRRTRFFRAGRGLACALLLLVMLRVLGQGLLLGVAGAALVLLLPELVDPTPLFWSVPCGALQLGLSRRPPVKHLLLLRPPEFA